MELGTGCVNLTLGGFSIGGFRLVLPGGEEDRNGRNFEHSLAHATQKDTMNEAMSVHAHDDEVCLELFRLFKESLDRGAQNKQSCRLDSLVAGGFRQSLDIAMPFSDMFGNARSYALGSGVIANEARFRSGDMNDKKMGSESFGLGAGQFQNSFRPFGKVYRRDDVLHDTAGVATGKAAEAAPKRLTSLRCFRTVTVRSGINSFKVS